MELESPDDTTIELKPLEAARPSPDSPFIEFIKKYEETAIAGVTSDILSLFLYSSWWVTDRKLPFSSLSQFYDYLLGGTLEIHYALASLVPLLATTQQERFRQLEAYFAKDLAALAQYAFDRFYADQLFRATWNTNNEQYLTRFALHPIEARTPPVHFGLLEREGTRAGHFVHQSLQAYMAARYVVAGLAGKEREGTAVVERNQQDEALDYVKERTHEAPHALLNWLLSGLLLDEERLPSPRISHATLALARAALQGPAQKLRGVAEDQSVPQTIALESAHVLVSVLGLLESATFQSYTKRGEAEASRLYAALHALGHVGQALGLCPRVAIGLLEARRSQALKSKLGSTRDSIRLAAIEALTFNQELMPSVNRKLAQLSEETDNSSVRVEIINTLVTVGVALPSVLDALTHHLGDRFPDVRQAAAQALVKLDATGVLIQVARDATKHYRMRHAAALALVPMGRFGASNEFVTLLLQALARKGSPSDRKAALHALAQACEACPTQTRETVTSALEKLLPDEKNAEVLQLLDSTLKKFSEPVINKDRESLSPRFVRLRNLNFTQNSAISVQLLFKDILDISEDVRNSAASIFMRSITSLVEEDFLKLIEIVEDPANEYKPLELAIKILGMVRIRPEKLSHMLYRKGDEVEKVESARSNVVIDYSHVKPPTALNIQDDPEAAAEASASSESYCIVS